MATRPPIRPPELKAALASKQGLATQQTDLWDKVVNDTTIPDDQKAETKEALRKLAFFDSIHDFWKERGGTKGVTDEDSGEPVSQNKDRIEAVKSKLVESIQTYVASKDPLEAILQNETNKLVYSTTSIEDKVLAYFKKKYKPFNQREQYMTVSQILREWVFKNDWDNYSKAIKTLPDALEIMIDIPSIKTLEDKERGVLGFFMLAYLDPETQPGKAEKCLTFDMSAGNIGQIFTRFTQVYNGVFPQNVSDSATTTFNTLLGRNKFFRADYTPSGEKKEVRKEVRSNAFTKGKYTLEFVDKGFGPKKTFDFYIEIKDQSGKVVGTIPFAEGQEQGPSVNYLMDIIVAGTPKGIDPKGKVARLNNLTVFDKDLLFDIKRMGDQEQMLVTSAYGVTGDRFAGAFRRLLRKPGIFQSVKGFRLWRAPLDSTEMEAQAVDYRRDQIIEKLKIISSILSSKPGSLTDIHNQLLQMNNQVIAAGRTGYVRNPPLTDILEKLDDPAFVAENYTQIAATVVTYIMRLRMRDIVDQIQSIIGKIESMQGKIPEVVKAACATGQPSPDPKTGCPPAADLSGITVEGALDTLEKFVNEIKGLKEMTIAFTTSIDARGKSTKKKEPTFVKLFDESGKLIKGSASILFNFSAAPFTHSEEGLGPVISQLLFISTSKRLDLADRKINSLLVEYFIARDQIKEAFFNEEKKKQIEDFTDITTGLAPTKVVTANTDGSQGLMEVIKRIIQDGELRGEADRGMALLADAAVKQAAAQQEQALVTQEEEAEKVAVAPSEGAQQGGAVGTTTQYRDLHDLFAEICLDAGHALDTNDNPVSALNDIELKWVLALNELRNSARDDYKTVFEESVSTDLISYLLSHRTSAEGVLFNVRPKEVDRRDQKWISEFDKMIAGRKVETEKFILMVLQKFIEQIVEEDPATKELKSKYAARDQWVNYLPGTLISTGTSVNTGTLSKEVQGLVRGGDLEEAEETTTNGSDVNATGSSRRDLYAGLRKRSGSGFPPEL